MINRIFILSVLLLTFSATFAQKNRQLSRFCWFTNPPVKGIDTTTSRAVADNYNLWDNGQSIRVQFLNGSERLQEIILRHAKEWESVANIRFIRNTGQGAHVRVKLYSGNGHFSYLGTIARLVPEDEPTMWLDTTYFNDQEELKATALHEFGHVLGLLHEHKHPLSGIKWNKEVFYKYYHQAVSGFFGGNHFPFEDLIDPYHSFYTNGTPYDNRSVMHYAIPSDFTLDGYSTGWNSELSGGDKHIAGVLYPRSGNRITKAMRLKVDLKELVVEERKDAGYVFQSHINFTPDNSGEIVFALLLYDSTGEKIASSDEQFEIDGTTAVYERLVVEKDSKGPGLFELLLPFGKLNLPAGQKIVQAVIRIYHHNKESDEYRLLYMSPVQSLGLTAGKITPSAVGARDLMVLRPEIVRDLPIPGVIQQTRVWCWLAVGEMLFRYYGVPNLNPSGNYQCGIIGSIMPAGSPCNVNCFNSSCIIPSGGNANTMRMLRDYPRLTANRTIGFQETYELSFAAVRENIDGGRPVICGISPVRRWYYNDAEHVVLLTGYELNGAGAFVIINDPFDYTSGDNPYIRAGASVLGANKYKLSYLSFVTDLFWHWSLSNITM